MIGIAVQLEATLSVGVGLAAVAAGKVILIAEVAFAREESHQHPNPQLHLVRQVVQLVVVEGAVEVVQLDRLVIYPMEPVAAV